MKILLAAVNAKFIHSNLAVRTLCAYAKKSVHREGLEIEIAEYTINQQKDEILRDIYERAADMICFSCYIWNQVYIESLIHDLSKVLPKALLWMGGPEVSYAAKEVLLRLPEVKGVMRGEGERTFAELCKGRPLDEIQGITFRRQDGGICENEWRKPMDLDEVPFVYQDMKEFEHKIVYYESSRGCPFSCSYCLSSVDKRLRFRSVQIVKRELAFFLEQKVSQVKFVDRTFNCNHTHAMEIWKFIAEHDNGVTNFHFEISADLLNEKELELIKTMRVGLIQLEIGVQSTNKKTIQEIKRTMDFEKLSQSVRNLRRMENVHQHLDLIAGLPFEDIASFSKSFDDVYSLRPHQLQLGFLKVLKGSFMEEKKADYGLVYKSEPPYEVLYTNWLSYEDILKLKGIEQMVEIYYNSGQFEHTLPELEKMFISPYRLYEKLWEYYKEKELHSIQHKRSVRYEILLDFVKHVCGQKDDGIHAKYVRELLIYDYYLRENAKTRPSFAGENPLGKEKKRRFYEEEAVRHKYLSGYEAYDKNQIRKMTHLEYFPVLQKTVLFDYMHRNPLNYEAYTYEMQ
ncbi:MAG: DUF4080 domain-containing protein [Dorea sp.]|nr:DUF4080 domain-containing protein [Dorea sp.]